MTGAGIFTIIVVLGMLIALVLEVLAPDAILFLSLGVLFLTGVLTPQEAFQGFSNQGRVRRHPHSHQPFMQIVDLGKFGSGNLAELIKTGCILKFRYAFIRARNKKLISSQQRFILEICPFNAPVAADCQHIDSEKTAKPE